MRLTATAPGKLFLLGEYAVLEGSPALVAAVSARARVTITSRARPGWSLLSRQAAAAHAEFVPGRSTGFALLDVVLAEVAADPDCLSPCDILLDTRPFFSPASGRKRGLGSSAALLVALWGALDRWLGRGESGSVLGRLKAMHDRFQGVPGSGADLAASLAGGLVRYRLNEAGQAETGSVQLPDSVGFACICTGQAASSPEFVGLFRAWQAQRPAAAKAHMDGLERVARAACGALDTGDGHGFLAAVDAYGVLLAELGGAIGAQIITPEHEQLSRLAEHHGVTYKSSGAGGGDMGVALAQDPQRLAAFVAGCAGLGLEALDIELDPTGLDVKGPAHD